MEITLKIPTTLEGITLGQYQKYLKIEEPQPEDIVSCFTGLTVKEVMMLNSHDVEALAERYLELLTEEPEFIPGFIKDGQEYGFIPNIDAITYGENKDITNFINSWDTMHNAMAVMFRKITARVNGRYNIQQYTGEEDAELMKDIPVTVALGAVFFFANLTNELLVATLNYLERLKKETKNEELRSTLQVSLQESGKVLAKFTHLLKET